MYGFTNIFLIFAPEIGVKGIFQYAKVLKYFQFTSFFHIKLMQSEKIRYKKRNG